MLVIASANGRVGIDEAWAVLDDGGTALDAVEAATRLVESNPDDHTVGYGGYPNLVGQVELDASIMDGAIRRAGAVGSLRGYRHAISVARAVMERLPHVLVVGDGAARLAAEIGMEAEDLLTTEAEAVWREGREGRAEQGSTAARMLHQVAGLVADPEHAAGTVNVIAVDRRGHVASAVSTSGWAWKYPGRLGDSPVIGAGNYADDRYGAAACTGWGELAIRCGTARSVVSALQAGVGVRAACEAAAREVLEVAAASPVVGSTPDAPARMHILALDAAGNHCGVTTSDEGSTYVFRADGMAAADEAVRIRVG